MKAVVDLCAQSVISCKNSLMSLFKCINLVVPQCICLLNNIKRLGNILTNLCFATLYNLINKSLQDCMSLSVSLSVSLAVSLSLAALLYWGSGAASIALNCSSLPPLTGYLSERGRESCAQHYSLIDVIYLSHTHTYAHIYRELPQQTACHFERYAR